MGNLKAVKRPAPYYGSCLMLYLGLLSLENDWFLVSLLCTSCLHRPLVVVCVYFNRRLSWQQHLLTVSVNLPLVQVSVSSMFLCGCTINSWPSSLLQPLGLLAGWHIRWNTLPNLGWEAHKSPRPLPPLLRTGKSGTTCSSTVITWPGLGRRASMVDWGAAASGASAGR